jgi:hypothetical protein
MNRRQLLYTALAAPAASLLAGLLAGCGGWPGPQVITLSEAELAQWVARSFPQTRRVLELLELELSAPQIRLLPDRNRLSVALSLRTRERLTGSTGRGSLHFECGLRCEPQDASLRLSQVRVQQIGFEPGTGAAAEPPAPANAPALQTSQRLGPALAERLLEDLAIYRLSAERQASLRQLGLQPGMVTVTARGVEITLARIGA